jgi:hypothetical protein
MVETLIVEFIVYGILAWGAYKIMMKILETF